AISSCPWPPSRRGRARWTSTPACRPTRRRSSTCAWCFVSTIDTRATVPDLDASADEAVASENVTDRAFVSHIARGGELLRAEKLEEACAELRLALELKPGDLKVLNLLGLVTFRLGRYGEARDIFQDLANRQPNDPSLQLNLGLVHLKMGEVDDAIRELARAKELDTLGQVRTLGYLGLAYA